MSKLSNIAKISKNNISKYLSLIIYTFICMILSSSNASDEFQSNILPEIHKISEISTDSASSIIDENVLKELQIDYEIYDKIEENTTQVFNPETQYILIDDATEHERFLKSLTSEYLSISIFL